LWDGGVADLIKVVEGFDVDVVDPAACVANAERFDTEVFKRAFPREVERALNEYEHRGAEHRPAPRTRFAWRPSRR
jgi:hypothetical protein